MAVSGAPQYGVRTRATAANNGTVLIIQRADNLAFNVNVTTLLTQNPAVAGTTYDYTDYLPNDGVTRYYRATESQTGYASASSSIVSSAPYNLGVA